MKKILGKQNKLENQMAFCMKVAEQQSGTKYVEEEDDDEEKEGWEDEKDDIQEEEDLEQVLT